MKRILVIFLILIVVKPSFTQEVLSPPYLNENSSWARNVLDTLTLEEKIAQLIMVAAYSKKGVEHQKEIEDLISQYKIGGLIFMQGGPERQIDQLNKYQRLSDLPLLISIDGEWGLSMRLDSTLRYPKQMALGAIQDNTLIYTMGKHIAEQCKRVGVHVNFAPVVDVNSNPLNPIINYRSFGENKYRVADKGVAYMKGLQDGNVLANAKHFPGHGDTDSDSHKTLPVINHSKERIDSVDLYPFKQLIKNGVGSMMVAHLSIPALKTKGNEASTLTPYVVDTLLKQELGFSGITFTDALNMKGVSKFYEPGEVDVKALLAGNDVLLFSEDVPTAIKKIKSAVKKGLISEDEIAKRVLKVLQVKEWTIGQNYQEISKENLKTDLHKEEYITHIDHLYRKAITIPINRNNILPLQLNTNKIAYINVGGKKSNTFYKVLSGFNKIDQYNLSKSASETDIEKIVAQLGGYETIIVSLHKTSNFLSRKYGVPSFLSQLFNLLANKDVIFNYPGNPYGLNRIKNLESIEGLIVSYEDNKYTQKGVAEAIFGSLPVNGSLPVTVNSFLKEGQGIVLNQNSLQYASFDEVGMNQEYFPKIDSIVKDAINQRATPGCQIVVLKDNKIVYEKNYGYTSYSKQTKIHSKHIYDLASITKIVASTASLMKLVDEGKLTLDDKLEKFLPELVDSTVYSNLKLREILAHQAKLVPWIPYYKKTLDSNNQPSVAYYKDSPDQKYINKVCQYLYAPKSIEDSIYKWIIETPLRTRNGYKYSDLGYYFIIKIIEKITNKSLDVYASETFYEPLGLKSLGYRPLDRFYKKQIVPTEIDKFFRKQIIQGDVHDQGAAMLGGVAGHAGVFSNALDLAKMMQLFLDNGVYNGDTILSEKVIKEFTKAQFANNRRGAGFDKPTGEDNGPTSISASMESFGHTGFTGTMAWADPKYNLIYVFLSNRTYPSSNNLKLIRMDVRTKIQELLYQSIKEGKK